MPDWYIYDKCKNNILHKLLFKMNCFHYTIILYKIYKVLMTIML